MKYAVALIVFGGLMCAASLLVAWPVSDLLIGFGAAAAILGAIFALGHWIIDIDLGGGNE